MVVGDSLRVLIASNTAPIFRVAPAPQGEGPVAVLNNVSGEQCLTRAKPAGQGTPEMAPWA